MQSVLGLCSPMVSDIDVSVLKIPIAVGGHAFTLAASPCCPLLPGDTSSFLSIFAYSSRAVLLACNMMRS